MNRLDKLLGKSKSIKIIIEPANIGIKPRHTFKWLNGMNKDQSLYIVTYPPENSMQYKIDFDGFNFYILYRDRELQPWATMNSLSFEKKEDAIRWVEEYHAEKCHE